EESFLRETLGLPNFIVDQMNVQGVFHHPTFLYESIWNLLGLILLLVLRRFSFMRAGELFATYFIWYSTGRFCVEGLRTDSLAFQGPAWLESMLAFFWSPMNILFEPGYLDPAYGNIRIAQLIGVIIILAAIILVILRRVMGYANMRYKDPINREFSLKS